LVSNNLGKKLHELREKCGYTQQQLAKVLNIDRSTYAYYETGKTSPDIPSLIVLANVFSISLEDLLGQEQQTPLNLNDSGILHNMVGNKTEKSVAQNDSHIYDLSKDEKQVICFYRAAKPEVRKGIMDYISGNNDSNKNNEAI
jgi:transcriptional regulator with XRE-family HTH domain